MKEKLDLFVSTGEVSGDLLASLIVKNLPDDLSIGGIIGPNLRKLDVKEYFPMELFEIHGLVAMMKGLPRVLRNFSKIKQKILSLNPKVVLLVDNVEFSLLLASSLCKGGYKGKIVQLVCPTVWAWRENRMKGMIKNLDLVLSLFPHEAAYFAKTTLAVEFIGHPLTQDLLKLEFPKAKNMIFALFPGSRKSEIKRNFSIQLRAAKQIADKYSIVVSAAKDSFIPLLKKMAASEGVLVKIAPPEKRYELMVQAEFALAKCGTTIFELGLLGTPTIVMYKMPWVDLMGALAFGALLPHYSLPNILLGKRIYPEHVGLYAVEKNILADVKRLAQSKELRTEIREAAIELKSIYTPYNASERAAQKIRNLLLLPS